jgi:hypothetical protein
MSDCVSCGFCCTRGPCAYGDWDAERGCCAFLTEPDSLGGRFCKIFKSIDNRELGEKYPMMGSGCSSTLCNDMRKARINNLKGKLV